MRCGHIMCVRRGAEGSAGHPALRRICEHVKRHASTVFAGDVDRQVLERTGPGAWTDAVLRCAVAPCVLAYG